MFNLCHAVSLAGFILSSLGSFQIVSQSLPLSGQLDDRFLQALVVGLQVRDGFDLVVNQKLCLRNVPIQLENILPQEIGRPLDALWMVLDDSQQHAILEVQSPEAG